jgi:hypothetical protein
MKVKDLIKKLQEVDQELPVVIWVSGYLVREVTKIELLTSEESDIIKTNSILLDNWYENS